MEKRHRIKPRILGFARELRHPLTPAEKALWSHLRDRQLGFKFRRQAPIGNYIVDFYCAEAALVVEVDGDSHADRERYDADRTLWLTEQGLRVIRFSNDEVERNPQAIVEAILSECSPPR